MERISNKKKKFIERNVTRLSIEEIAREIGLSPAQVKSCIDEGTRLAGKDTRGSKSVPDARDSQHKRYWFLGVVSGIIFLLALAVYIPALRGGFIWDDNEYVYENVNVRTLTLKSLVWMFTSFHSSNWHPLTWLSHALDCELWGLAPFGHHLTSIILHAMNTVLVLWLCMKLMVRVRRSAHYSVWIHSLMASGIAALLFSLHPLQVESVAWVTERKNLLSLFFSLLTLLAYLTYVSLGTKKDRSVWFTVTLVLFMCAVLSKPMAVTLPAVLLLIDYYPLRRLGVNLRGTMPMIFEKLPFFLLSCVSSVLTVLAQHSGGALKSFERMSPGFRILNASDSLIFYLKKMAFPFQLVPFYPLSEHTFPIESSYAVSSMLVIAITAGCVWMARRRRPLFLTAWMYYVITLLPVLGIIQVGGQKAADRYLYHPGIGIFLLLGVGVVWLWEKVSQAKALRAVRWLLVGVFIAVGGFLAAKTVSQIKIWKNGEVFWSYIIKAFPGNVPEVYDNLGMVYVKEGRLDEAIENCRKAIAIKPRYAEGRSNLGNAYLQKGMLDEAITEYKRAIDCDPAFAKAYTNLGLAYEKKGMLNEAIVAQKEAIALNPHLAIAYYNLGLVYGRKKMVDEAISAYEKAIADNPYYAEAYNNLGLLYAKKNRVDDALAAYGKALDVNPALVAAYYNRGNLYVEKGMLDEALSDYQRAIALRPEHAEAHAGLGRVYAKRGKFDEAVNEYKSALSINPRSVEIYYNLGLAYDKVGRLDEALAAYAQALAFNPRYLEAHINLGRVYHKKGKLVEAIAEYNKALSLNPSFAMAYNNLGMVYDSMGKLDDAITHYNKALSLNPRYAMAHANLASAYVAKGNYTLAIQHCDQAGELGYEIDPEVLKKLSQFRN